jgi:serine/threonine protein kinase
LAAPRTHSADTFAPGQRIGPFLLLAPLGTGGSGRVWAVARGGQLGFAKRMALKVMRTDKLGSARARERFDREACLAAQLSHANLRAVHDLGSFEGRPYMAMSWVDTSLAELLEHAPGKRLEPEVVCWLGIQCCDALVAAHGFVNRAGHAAPIVHRDVSPGNILLTVDGHVMLADLTAPGTASPSPDETPPDTRFFGSLGYAAPEALREEVLDGRADLFSLGCVLYEALSGSPAFDGDDERSMLFQVLEQGPVDLAKRAPLLPGDLVKVVSRALERQAEHRYPSAEAMRTALCQCVAGLSAFSLEEGTAALIRRVLGSHIRAREEAMHLAFQRFSPSQFERTDTLPIGNGAVQQEQETLDLSGTRRRPTAADVVAGIPSAAQFASNEGLTSWRRPVGLVLGAVAALLLAYGLCSPSGLERIEPAQAPELSPNNAPNARQLSPEPRRESNGLQPQPQERADLETGAPINPAPANPPAAPAEGSGPAPAGQLAGAPISGEAAGPLKNGEGLAAQRAPHGPTSKAQGTPHPARRRDEVPKERVPKRPFDFKFEDGNPYEEGEAGRPGGAPAREPPKASAPQ